MFVLMMNHYASKGTEKYCLHKAIFKKININFKVLSPCIFIFLKYYLKLGNEYQKFLENLIDFGHLDNESLKQLANFLDKNDMLELDKAFTEKGVSVNSFKYNFKSTLDAHADLTLDLEKTNIAIRKINFKLRDWVFSRQRYWGEPIPIYFDSNDNIYTVDELDLPLTLPEMKDGYKHSENEKSPLAMIDDWVYFKKDGKQYRRETDTMPQWAGSCWYYIRYLDPNNNEQIATEKKIDYWLPVDIYIGGGEHAVLHLFYARFWHKVLYDIGVVNTLEPFITLVNQGMITSFAYKTKEGRMISVDSVYEKDNKFYDKETDLELERVITKMSKSLKNVVNPDKIIEEHGTDSFRLYLMFLGPLTQSKPWDIAGIQGVKRFLNRVWRMQEIKIAGIKDSKNILISYNKTVKNVKKSTEKHSFNTAISANDDICKHRL